MKSFTFLSAVLFILVSSGCGCRLGDSWVELDYVVFNGHSEGIDMFLTTDIADSVKFEVLSLDSFVIGSSSLMTSCGENAQDRLDDAELGFEELIIVDASGDTCNIDARDINNWVRTLIDDENGTISLNLTTANFE